MHKLLNGLLDAILFGKNNIATAAFHEENSRQALKKKEKKKQVLETNNIVLF